MTDVVSFPGKYVPAVEKDAAVEDVLKGAVEANLQDIVIVGRNGKGGVCMWGSSHDADKTIGLLTRGITLLASGTQVTEE